MRFLISIIAIVALSVLMLSACNSAGSSVANSPAVAKANPAAATAPQDGVRRITAVELKALLEQGQAVVVDVRNQSAFDQGHIKGSKLIPSNEILNHTSELPRD